MPPRLTASLLHLSLIISGLCLSCAASLRSLPLSPARIVFSELNGNEHGENGFCKWTPQNFVTYPLFGDVLVCVTRARGGGLSEVPGFWQEYWAGKANVY